MPFPVACSQITWGSFRKAEPEKWTEDAILAAIAQAGYTGAPAGMWSGRTAAQVAEVYARHGLKPAPGYMSVAFWKAENREKILEQAKRQGAFARELGCTELYVASAGFGDYIGRSGKTRGQVAAHSGPEDSLTDDENKRFADCLNETGRITLAEGVKSCLHNHVGTPIETREEIDRLMVLTDPNLVFLGPDTGHLAWAGADCVSFFRDYALRIKTVHLKDIHAPVVAQGRKENWDYGGFSAHGVFAEFGEGCVDFPKVFDILTKAGMKSWIIVEIDQTTKPSPVESITVCRDYLKKIGYWPAK